MKANFSKLILAAAIVAVLPASSDAANKKVTLGKGQVQNTSYSGRRYLCGAPSSSWVPVKKIRGTKYELIKAANTHKLACRALLARGKIKSLSQLPDVSGMTRANGASGSSAAVSSVSGTPPVIRTVPDLDPTTLFWRAGVVAAITGGSPTAEQCNEFWGSPVDGESAGQTACYMLQDVGQSIQTIQEAGQSLCYMRNFPTSGVVNSGAATRTGGTLPSGGMTHIFDVPSGSSARVVKINTTGGNMGGGTMFLRIYAQTQLDNAAAAYKFQTWQCVNGSAVNSETATVKLSGEFIATNSNMNDSGVFTSTVRGYLTPSGRTIVFDATRDRSAAVQASYGSEIFKSAFTINSDNEITSKFYVQGSGQTRKAYSISHFSGSSSEDLRFLEGAIKMEFNFTGSAELFQGGNEYRDSTYASSPSSDYATEVTAFDIGNDSFYSSLEAPTVDLSDFNCNATPTVTISLNMENPAMAAVVAECEADRLNGFDMCNSNTDVSNAMQNFHTACGSH